MVVIGVTAALASYAPPVTAQSGPFSAESTVGPIQLEMSVEPATVGANEIHLYLFDARSGAPYEKVKQLTVSAALPEKSISLPLEPQLSGPGHYTIPGALLNAGGDWRLDRDDARLRLRRVHEDGRGPGQVTPAGLRAPYRQEPMKGKR